MFSNNQTHTINGPCIEPIRNLAKQQSFCYIVISFV